MTDMLFGAFVASVVWGIAYFFQREDLCLERTVAKAWKNYSEDGHARCDRLLSKLDKANHDLARCRDRLDKVVAAMRDKQ